MPQTYTAAGQPDIAAYTAGPLAGISVANTYDALSRRTAVSVTRHPTPDTLSLTSFSYDAASRLHTVSNGTNVFTYSYVPGTPGLVAELAAANGAGAVMTTTKTYDYLSRLTAISSTRHPTLDTLSSFS